MDTLHSNNFFSTSQAAELLNVTRITIFRWIKDGSLKASKIGRNYIIPRDEVFKHLHKQVITDPQKNEIKILIDKTIKDYGETIRMLGHE